VTRDLQTDEGPESLPAESCPRCHSVEVTGPLEEWEGAPCPTCGRTLPFPKDLPGGTVLTMLLSLDLLGKSIIEVWETARNILEDEGVRTGALPALDPETPDAMISINEAEVPDPVTPEVEKVVHEEGAEALVGVRRLLYALAKRRALLTTILKETYGAGFQRDEARVAARLGVHLNTVKLAVHGKKLVRV
jgi:hypothetical protein